MNILIIPSYIYTKSGPTIGSFFYEQALALAKTGQNVYILFCDTYSIKEIHKFLLYDEDTVSDRDNIHLYRKKSFCPLKHDSGYKGTREIFTMGIIDLYNKYLRNVHIDVIHAHCCMWAGYAAMELSKKIKTPYIITEHSSFYGTQIRKLKGEELICVKKAFTNAKKVICVSEALKELIISYCGDTCVVVLGNVIDCNLFDVATDFVRKNTFDFLTVCHMRTIEQLRGKGIDILLHAYADLLKKYSEAHLVIGGDGTGKAIVERWIRELNIEDKVTLLGSLSREAVAKEMKKCDVFVLPSRHETFGVVYTEAMACGKPVIATRTGGALEFINKSNGILVDTDNAVQLSEAMNSIIENIDSYDPNEIREGVVSLFSMETIAHELCMIYSEVGNTV